MNDRFDERIEAAFEQYLDESMAPAAREEFEQRLRRDGSLRVRIKLQKHIDKSLRRSCDGGRGPSEILAALNLSIPVSGSSAYQSNGHRHAADIARSSTERENGQADAEAEATNKMASRDAGKKIRAVPHRDRSRSSIVSASPDRTETVQGAPRVRTTATAGNRRRARLALLVIAACLPWLIVTWLYYPSAPQPSAYPTLSLAAIYRQSVAAGFRPTWVCETDRQFAKTFFDRQGEGLLLEPMPEGSGMVGLAYFSGVSSLTTTMLARVDGEPVLVFVDRAQRDSPRTPPDAQSGLNQFSRELGDLVVYEITPFNKPRVMQYLYEADVPEVATPLESVAPE